MASLDKILETPPAELLDDLRDLRQQKADLGNRERVVVQLLEMILEQGGEATDEVVRLAAEAAIAIGPLRDQVRQVMASKQADNENFLAPIAVHQELVARGNQTATLDHVRTIMKRMADAGELLQPRPSVLLFGLPNVVNNPIAMQALDAVLGDQ
ncbi:MAG TPA: hypothetical protein VGL68_03805 [Solirubrobacteraceae bacterium]|jgi:hypothetical protein